jgi:protein-disulfide isomerase
MQNSEFGSKKILASIVGLLSLLSCHHSGHSGSKDSAGAASCTNTIPVYEIDGKSVTLTEANEISKTDLEKIRFNEYQILERQAHRAYLNAFFASLAASKKITEQEARDQYFAERAPAPGNNTPRPFLERKIHQEIITEGQTSGRLKILWPKPQTPKFNVAIESDDPVRYGPNVTDTKPMGCSDDCVTIVVYSDYQCPFCKKLEPSVKQLMADYQGKVRWVAKHFPLRKHKEAQSAATAARCAHEQGSFWQMHEELMQNQKSLSAGMYKQIATRLKLNLKEFEQCQTKRGLEPLQRVDGVSGTPTVFVNGKKAQLSNDQSHIRELIDSSLADATPKK